MNSLSPLVSRLRSTLDTTICLHGDDAIFYMNTC